MTRATAQPAFVQPCKTKSHLFHAPHGERTDNPERDQRIAEAVDLCLDCPLMIACRDLGRALRERGVWGGETDDERAAAGYPPKGDRTSSPIIRRSRARILASR